MNSRTRSIRTVALLGCVVGASAASAQVAERDTRLTGPKGRTIERSIRTERGPGFVDRKIEIKRPGGTLTRETRLPQPGGYAPRPGPPGGPPRSRIIERDVVVERNVFVERPPLIAPFVAPFLSFSFGAPPPPPPPPPVVYIPEPVYIAAPMVVAQPPVVVTAPAYSQTPGPPVALEPTMPLAVADAVGRLASLHHQSRRDGALTLGNLGDDRAVAPLIDRLEHDFDREVRVAAAWALGEIGDPRAAVVLQRAALYDRRQEVRAASATAYQRLPRPGQDPIGPETAATGIDPGPHQTYSADGSPPFPSPVPQR